MSDLEIVKACAVAMGYSVINVPEREEDCKPALAQLNCLRKTSSLAMIEYGGELMLDKYGYPTESINVDFTRYDPLHDDAQAMSLVKRFGLDMSSPVRTGGTWSVSVSRRDLTNKVTGWELVADADNEDLNRAICSCVARMAEQGKGGE